MTNFIPNFEIIVATDINKGISKNNTIPWKNSTDMNFFKNKTLHNIVVMGSKTLLSLPKQQPLINRFNYVITNNPDKFSDMYKHYNNIKFLNFEDTFQELLLIKDKTIFIIGGAQIYTIFYPFCSTIWFTKIKSDYKCDLTFNCNIINCESNILLDNDELSISKLTRC